MNRVREDFRGELAPPLMAWEEGVGRIEHVPGGGVRLALDHATGDRYSNAQIDDYLHGQGFTRRPPLRMTVRAGASHNVDELKGTAGFGFWTQPVMPGRVFPILPRAVW